MNKQRNPFSFFPEQASNFARDVDMLYFFLVGMSVVVSVLIALALILLALRYHRKKHLDKGEDVHGNNVLEVVWSVIPLIVAMVIFFWAAKLYFDYKKPPDNAMEILVTGKQWMWKLQHPNGKRELNTLHVPMGQPVKMTMTSEDVIHSFYIPAFRTKSDVVPGRYTQIWFTPTKEGKFHLFCAEYCGTEHSEMIGYVKVLSPAKYEQWLTGGEVALSPVEAGERLFAKLGCASCHAGQDNALGPNIAGAYGQQRTFTDGSSTLGDDDYLRESILMPQKKVVNGFQPIMPSFKGLVTESQLMQLIAYIKSIAENESAGEDG
jgi:cytochrome c oxidase subunit 2